MNSMDQSHSPNKVPEDALGPSQLPIIKSSRNGRTFATAYANSSITRTQDKNAQLNASIMELKAELSAEDDTLQNMSEKRAMLHALAQTLQRDMDMLPEKLIGNKIDNTHIKEALTELNNNCHVLRRAMESSLLAYDNLQKEFVEMHILRINLITTLQSQVSVPMRPSNKIHDTNLWEPISELNHICNKLRRVMEALLLEYDTIEKDFVQIHKLRDELITALQS